jgi:hypothetical protein
MESIKYARKLNLHGDIKAGHRLAGGPYRAGQIRVMSITG